VSRDLPWGPAADGHDQPYWDGLTHNELRFQRCSNCQTWIWGPQQICPNCHGFDLDWQRVQPVGTVYSWSRSWYPFIEEFADRLPYVSVLVEVDQTQRRRVLGVLVGDGTDGPRIGDRVEGVFEHAEGETWPLLRWQRVDQGAGR
jgi:uncharacterized protein